MPKQSADQRDQPESEDSEDRTNFSARVRVSTKRRAKLYAAGHDINLQDLMDAALDEYLANRGA